MTTLTRKHFECIAANLRKSQPTHPSAKLGYHLAVTAVANALQELEPRTFDRARFVAACVPKAGEQYALPTPQVMQAEPELA
jgi:hypothetical protein